MLQARRERQNRISSLMGDYLLRGYRMLGDTCADCGVRTDSECGSRDGAGLQSPSRRQWGHTSHPPSEEGSSPQRLWSPALFHVLVVWDPRPGLMVPTWAAHPLLCR